MNTGTVIVGLVLILIGVLAFWLCCLGGLFILIGLVVVLIGLVQHDKVPAAVQPVPQQPLKE